jgi:hypothetical protein
MAGPWLSRYRRVSLFFAGWLGLLKLAVVMPLVVYVTLLFLLPPMSWLLASFAGHPITIAWLFHTSPVSMWSLFIGSIFLGWAYFWCERRFFLHLLGPPAPSQRSVRSTKMSS